MKSFKCFDHAYTSEKNLSDSRRQIDVCHRWKTSKQSCNIHNLTRNNRRMAYIQCSLLGIALDWYTTLHTSYKQQWHSFDQLLKKQILSQTLVFYSRVEAMSRMREDNETVRYFALRVQQLFKKRYCNGTQKQQKISQTSPKKIHKLHQTN